MLFGMRCYREGQFQPERVDDIYWNVWCCTGAVQVLEQRDFIRWLTAYPGDPYIVNFANGAVAMVKPGDRLWQVLVQITKTHKVTVFPLDMSGKYVPWLGDEGSLEFFDAIAIETS